MSDLLTEQRTTQQESGEAVVNIRLKLQHLKYQDNSRSNIIIRNTIIVMFQLLWKKCDNCYRTNFITCNVIAAMGLWRKLRLTEHNQSHTFAINCYSSLISLSSGMRWPLLLLSFSFSFLSSIFFVIS